MKIEISPHRESPTEIAELLHAIAEQFESQVLGPILAKKEVLEFRK
jgi:hypothetical protein